MHEEIIRKQANEIVEKARQQGKVLDSEQLKKQLLLKINNGNNSDDEGGEKQNSADESSNVNQLNLRKKKSKGGNFNPNNKGYLKSILAIIPEERNVQYVDN